ncbi:MULTISPECIES: tetratricopeptide repeat-containing sensor histidine kinase [unclassified Algibacter]|uniref:tetratricopeptide repeat-containing sensor histidine kinase n=1 Tax=unclassified Algibacter TaxID=2615009 RepID=UPI00131E44D3|nr:MULTISPECIES: tetratricopeptide repeat-containing sensor histidine kinase [unclassified Algibacter]MCL5128257.1 tetratricopeptide repeat protein [Algibacter sp. L4_22]
MKVNKTSFLFFWFIVINTFCIVSHNLVSQNKRDSTLFYYKAITELKDVKSISKSFEFFKKKADQALLNNNTERAAYYLELIALGQLKMGFSYESEANSIKALKLLNKSNSKSKKDAEERLSNHLGMIYRRLEDFENARRYYNQALELNTKLEDKIAIITNIANTYADQKKYDKAIETLSKSYDDAVTLDNSEIKATYFDNFGFFSFKTKRSRALKEMEGALKMRLELQDLSGLFSSYRHLSLFFSEKGNKIKALYYADKVTELSNNIQAPAYQIEALALKLNLENNSDFHKYVALNKQVKSKSKLWENKFAAIKYNVALKEKLLEENQTKLLVSEFEKEKERTYKWLYLTLWILIVLLSILIFFTLNAKHRKDRVQEVYVTEKRISKRIHDEVANDVYQVMTKLQYEQVGENEVLLDELEHIYNKTRDISRESGTIDLETDFGVILNDLLLIYETEGLVIITRGLKDINWQTISKLKRTTIYRVLQELMTNMKKHSKATLVSVSFNKNKNVLEMNYADNGVGAELKRLNGLGNVETRIHALRGSVIFSTKIGEGFKVKAKI